MGLGSTIIVSVLTVFTCARADQLADGTADTSVRNATFRQSAGTVVAIDSGHNNYHTVGGRYAPFASLLRNDGLRVVDLFGGFFSEISNRRSIAGSRKCHAHPGVRRKRLECPTAKRPQRKGSQRCGALGAAEAPC